MTRRFPLHTLNLLAFAGMAAGVSGSALVASVPVAVPAVAQAAAVQVPVAVAPVAVAVAAAVTAVAAPEVAEAAEPAVPAQTAAAAPGLMQVALQQPALPKAGRDMRAYYEHLRAQLRWVPVRVGGRELETPDAASRLLLARSAAERAGLAEVGLDFRDVYGVINAETTWVARTGMGKNGVASQGLAQLEPATARALGVHDANDPVEAVHAAATLLKEAATWSARRIAGLSLSGVERAARLREGVSIYYNLSSRARERWNGLGTAAMPIETLRHIANVRAGAQLAERLHSGAADTGTLLAQAAAAVRAAPAETVKTAAPATTVRTADVVRTSARRGTLVAAAKPAAPRPLGTIAWSGQGGDVDQQRGGGHVVWSDGSVTREGNGRVRWTSSGRG